LQVECTPAPGPRVADVLGPDLASRTLRVYVNGSLVECKPHAALATATRNGQPCKPEDPVADGDVLTAPPPDAASLIFADLLAHVDVAKTPPPGSSRLVMLLNGRSAEFTSPVRDGDKVELAWE
jgi:hypothetical protein